MEMRHRSWNVVKHWGLTRVIATLLLSLAALTLPGGIGAPSPAHAQQSVWGIFVGYSWSNYTVENGIKSSFSDDLNNGCWGNYGNQWPMGSTPTAPRWAAIAADGKMTGGCRIQENNRLIQGTLSGAFDGASQTISAFHLETSETLTVTISGKISIGKSTTIVDGSGGPASGTSGSYTHEVKGNYTHTYEATDLATPKKLSGTVTIPLSIVRSTNDAYRLKMDRINDDRLQPFFYQPLAFRITLEKQEPDGTYKAARNELVKALNPWNDLRGGILVAFQASDCQNCKKIDYLGEPFALTDPGPDDIQLKTDEKGQATFTLYLDLSQLADAKLLPSRTNPRPQTLRAVFETGTGANKKTLAEIKTDVNLQAIAVVEKIIYTRPTMWDPITGVERFDSQRPTSLEYFTADIGEQGTQVGSWILKGAERVRLVPEGKIIGPIDPNRPAGQAMKPGDLISPNDGIFITACGMPNPNRLQDGKFVGQPSNITIQFRFFDGVKGQVVVNNRVCDESMVMGTVTDQIIIEPGKPKTLKVLLYLKTAVNFFFPENPVAIAEKAIKTFAFGRFVPVYDAYNKVPGYIEIGKSALGLKTQYIRLNSQVYVASDSAGNIRVTTREGLPILYTAGTDDNGIVVPVGQTAVIPDSMIPRLEKTDAATAQTADELLNQMSSNASPAANAPSASTLPVAPSNLIGLAFLAMGGIATLGIGGLLVIVLVRRTGTRSASASRPRPTDLPERHRPRPPTDLPR